MNSKKADNVPKQRLPLSRERILQAAVNIADREGLDALTMRRIGSELQVEAMSLYKHVANKDAILDGIIDQVVGEIEVPTEGDWKKSMRKRAHSAREVFARHSWAVGLYDGRSESGPASLRHADATIGVLRSAGFSIDAAAHAFWIIDCFIYGQVVMESSFSFDSSADKVDLPDAPPVDAEAAEFPHLVELGEHVQNVEFTTLGEFEHGLDLILDALAARQ